MRHISVRAKCTAYCCFSAALRKAAQRTLSSRFLNASLISPFSAPSFSRIWQRRHDNGGGQHRRCGHVAQDKQACCSQHAAITLKSASRLARQHVVRNHVGVALTAHDWWQLQHALLNATARRITRTLSSPSAGSSNFWAVILYMRSPRRDLIMLNVIFCPSLVPDDDLSTAYTRHNNTVSQLEQRLPARRRAACPAPTPPVAMRVRRRQTARQLTGM